MSTHGPATVGMTVTHRRYVPYSHAHYAGNLVDGAYSLAAFGDVATEMCIRTDGDEGLFASYSDVQFRAPVRAGDCIEIEATLVRVGSRSREMSFEVRVVTRGNPVGGESSADLLNERVLPFYEAEGLAIHAILTDRGTEFKGVLERHHYELFLALNDIEHRLTKVGTPRTNGFVERFHRTVLDEFFREAFRKKFYPSVAELQKDLDAWLHNYNYERPHRGYRNIGRKPHETFMRGKREVEKHRTKGKDKEVRKEAA